MMKNKNWKSFLITFVFATKFRRFGWTSSFIIPLKSDVYQISISHRLNKRRDFQMIYWSPYITVDYDPWNVDTPFTIARVNISILWFSHTHSLLALLLLATYSHWRKKKKRRNKRRARDPLNYQQFRMASNVKSDSQNVFLVSIMTGNIGVYWIMSKRH